MKRIIVFVYGVISYVIFLGTFCYAAGFVGNILVPRAIDGPVEGPLWQALLINVGLLTLFALQHSIMARPGFKRWLTKFIPKPAERSTYVLASSLALILLFVLWRPMGGVVWHIEDNTGRAVMYALFGFGWMLVLVTTYLINHFDLFGLRQVWLYLRGIEYTHLPFKTPSLYKYVRHPLYIGWLFAFWATPTMTMAHLVFAIGTTAYILIAIRFEERDLAEAHGDIYLEYQKRVPMLVPALKPVTAESLARAETQSESA